MGSDWWMFDQWVEEYAEKKCKEFKKEFRKAPKKAYISDNLSAARYVVKKYFPKTEIIEDNSKSCTGFDQEFILE